jgi:type VI secretion system protein VasD
MAIRPSSVRKYGRRGGTYRAKGLKPGLGGWLAGTDTRRWTYRVRLIVAACAACLITGCGIVQAVRDGAFTASKSPTALQAKTITFDLAAQPLINPDPDGQPLSVVLRFYQLKDVTTFAELTYVQLQRDDQKLLRDDLLATKDVVLRPGATTSMTEQMNEATQVVGVVAFFREPSRDKTWKLAISREQWDEAHPVMIVADGNELRLVRADPPAK